MRTRSATLATAIVALAFIAGACGGGGNGSGVATLAGSHTTTTAKKSKEAAKQEMQDATLAFARCMRQHGVDMPDPTFNESGGGGFAIKQAGPGGGGARPSDATFQAAEKACQPILDKAEQDMPRPSPEEEAKMRDQALKFAKCMREHGIDMPDPTFDDSGRAKIEMHAGGNDGNGSGPVTNGKGVAPAPPGDNAKMEAAAKACGGPGGPGGFSTGSDKE